jgi:actin-related protein
MKQKNKKTTKQTKQYAQAKARSKNQAAVRKGSIVSRFDQPRTSQPKQETKEKNRKNRTKCTENEQIRYNTEENKPLLVLIFQELHSIQAILSFFAKLPMPDSGSLDSELESFVKGMSSQ